MQRDDMNKDLGKRVDATIKELGQILEYSSGTVGAVSMVGGMLALFESYKKGEPIDQAKLKSVRDVPSPASDHYRKELALLAEVVEAQRVKASSPARSRADASAANSGIFSHNTSPGWKAATPQKAQKAPDQGQGKPPSPRRK